MSSESLRGSEKVATAPTDGDRAAKIFSSINEKMGNTLGKLLGSLLLVVVVVLLYTWSLSELHGEVVDRLSEGRNSLINLLVGPIMAAGGLTMSVSALVMIVFSVRARSKAVEAAGVGAGLIRQHLGSPSEWVVYGVAAVALVMLVVSMLVASFHSRSEEVYRGFLYVTVVFYLAVLGLAVYNYSSVRPDESLTRFIVQRGGNASEAIEVASAKAGATAALAFSVLGGLQSLGSIYVLYKTDGTQVVSSAIGDLNALRIVPAPQ